MGKSFLLSTALHGFVILFTLFGLPFVQREKIVVEDTIVVELVEIAEVTAAPPPKPKPEPEPEPKPAPAPPEPEPAPAPPEPEPTPAPPPPPPEAPAPKPEPEKVAEAPPVPKVAAPPRKPVPPKKPEPPKKEDSFDQLVSLVKDLKQEVAKRPTPPQEPTEAEPDDRVRTLLNADRATLSERDAIRAHIENCWRIDPGKEGLQDLSADIKVTIQPDGSVRQALIENTARYFSDPQFRTFADSARAAVLSCSNIPISPQRYETFKEIVFTFSPQGRLN